MIGKTIPLWRDKILEKLGGGGMGEVYLAEDTKLDREVAISWRTYHAENKPKEDDSNANRTHLHTNWGQCPGSSFTQPVSDGR